MEWGNHGYTMGIYPAANEQHDMEIPQLPGSHLCSWWVFHTYLKLLEGANNNIKNTSETQLSRKIVFFCIPRTKKLYDVHENGL